MNSIWSALWLTSDKLSSSSDSSWSLSWCGGDCFVTSYCYTFPVQLLDSPVISCLSGDRHCGTCSHVFGGISSTTLSSIQVSVMSQTFCMSGAFPVGFPTVSVSPSDAGDSSSASCPWFPVVFLHTGICLVILAIWYRWHTLVAGFNVYHSCPLVFREYNL